MTDVADSMKDDGLAEEAAGWVARLGSRDATEQDRRRFELWKAQSPDHVAAYDEMCMLWSDLAHVPKSVAPRRRGVIGGTVAALLVMGCLGYIADDFGLIDRLRADHYSSVGEVEIVTLDDGSTVSLNTDSAVQVRFQPNERRVVLLRGEAFFDVAPNPARPFVVSGHHTQAIALGTHYAVRVGVRDEVMVEEGHVAVTLGSQRAVLEAGGMAHLDDDGKLQKGTGDVASLTSWRTGKLVFSGQQLGSVLDELGRYHRGKILVLDAATSQIRVSGVFDTGNVDQALDALQESLPIQVTRLTGWVTIVRPR